MKEPTKYPRIRDRYVRSEEESRKTGITYPHPITFPKPDRDADPKSLIFLIGFIFSADPVPEPEKHDPTVAEILVCD